MTYPCGYRAKFDDVKFKAHMKICDICQRVARELARLASRGVPLSENDTTGILGVSK